MIVDEGVAGTPHDAAARLDSAGRLSTADSAASVALPAAAGIGEEGIDLALLPIGDNYTMGPDDALRAVKLLQPRKVMPIHYNTFPLIAQDPQAWAARVRKETHAEVLVPKPGDWVNL